MLNSSSSEFELLLALLARGLDHFEHGADVLLDGEAAKDRGFLRQIADAEPRALIHRQLGDVVAVELDRAAIGLDQAGDHVEHGGLAGAVRAEQADRFAAAHIDADAAHHLAAAETLFHAMHSQEARPLQKLRSAGAVGPAGGPHGMHRLGTRRFGLVVGLVVGLEMVGRAHLVARDRRCIPHRAGHETADAVTEGGDVLARKSWPAALGGAPTEHAEEIDHPAF